MAGREIRTILKDDPLYPEKMKQLSDMPDTLYALDALPDPEQPTVAIVGARLCSAYGRNTAYDFGHILASHGVQIISGMAAGIDSSSQEGALDAGGRSYAVLGCGVDVCYPRANTTLYHRLIKEGGVLSEQPPGTPPLPYYFPSRNRIISALADIVIVVEARVRSGSLITVDFALAQGRSVYAVPGRVGDALSDGCNALIAQGAGIAYAPEAILNELKMLDDALSGEKRRKRAARRATENEKRVQAMETITAEAKQIYALLEDNETQHPDALASLSSLPLPQVRAALMELIREGLAEESARDNYLRCSPVRE